MNTIDINFQKRWNNTFPDHELIPHSDVEPFVAAGESGARADNAYRVTGTKSDYILRPSNKALTGQWPTDLDAALEQFVEEKWAEKRTSS